MNFQTVVDACTRCGHAQTRPPNDLASYYSTEYNFRIDSPDEDDLYERRGESTIYRSEHQVAIVERFVPTDSNVRVLDFGCGKARSLRLLAERFENIEPFVYDVSDVYRPFWNAFVSATHQAAYTLPAEWEASMDLVLSFFALEHVPNPQDFLKVLHGLLTPGGRAIVIFPNTYTNRSDLVVADHINHFSRSSLTHVFAGADFTDVHIDEDSFRGAFVVSAARATSGSSAVPLAPEATQLHELTHIADFWKTFSDRVRAFESTHAEMRAAIYGSGVYGLYLAASLLNRGNVQGFLDQNAFRHHLRFFDLPVRAPEFLADDVDVVYVGLNPMQAHAIIDALPVLRHRPRSFFFP